MTLNRLTTFFSAKVIVKWGTTVKNAFNQLFNKRVESNVREKFAEKVFGAKEHECNALYVDGEGDQLYQHLKGLIPQYTVRDFVHDASDPDVGIEKNLIVNFIDSIRDL